MVTILINIIIGIVQEIKAKRTIEKLSLLTAPVVKVIRDGVESNINSVNSNSKKYTAFARSSSLPKKVIVSKDNLIFVNQDGSISWLKPNSTSILYNWYITTDNLIVTEK